jgi:regulator of sigma D
MFAPLKSAALAYSLQADLIINVDGNNEDAIDRLLKVRDNVPMKFYNICGIKTIKS